MIYAFLAGWIIKKNSSDSKRKVDFVRQYFKTHFSVVHISSTESIVDGLKNETNVHSIAKWILSKLNKPEERIQIIDFLFEIVKIDGAIIDREFVAIVRFAELIGVKASYIDKKMQEFQEENFKRYQSSTANKPSKRTHALFVLHLSEGFTSEQLKRSYRKLAVKYHPDKQTTATESEKEIAQQKFIEIQEAYDFLSK